LEAGRKFDQPIDGTNLVVLTVASKDELHFAIDQIKAAGICCVVFNEPDDDLGDTAACTEPIEAAQRRIFKRWSLWSEDDRSNKQRGPPM
jgi:hypothetical protein